jgi:hypothetical protein
MTLELVVTDQPSRRLATRDVSGSAGRHRFITRDGCDGSNGFNGTEIDGGDCRSALPEAGSSASSFGRSKRLENAKRRRRSSPAPYKRRRCGGGCVLAKVID